MKFTYEIKDELVQGVGTKLGNPDNPEEAIEYYFQDIANKFMSDIVETSDPEVLHLKQQLNSKIQEKKSEFEVRVEAEIKEEIKVK